MTSNLRCPPCASFFNIEQWLWQNNNITSLNVADAKNRRTDFTAHTELEQTDAPVNIFHTLFKIIETKNV